MDIGPIMLTWKEWSRRSAWITVQGLHSQSALKTIPISLSNKTGMIYTIDRLRLIVLTQTPKLHFVIHSIWTILVMKNHLHRAILTISFQASKIAFSLYILIELQNNSIAIWSNNYSACFSEKLSLCHHLKPTKKPFPLPHQDALETISEYLPNMSMFQIKHH